MRVECKPEEATVAVWGSVEYRPLKSSFMWWESASGAVFASDFMISRGAKFYKEETPEPCVVSFDRKGYTNYNIGFGNTLRYILFGDSEAAEKAADRKALLLLLEKDADPKAVYAKVKEIEGVER